MSLPTLAAQLREQEQTLRKLSWEPVNAPVAREVREAVDELVEQWQRAADDRDAGREHDWEAKRARSQELWRIINDHGGSDAWPDECDRAGSAFMCGISATPCRRNSRESPASRGQGQGHQPAGFPLDRLPLDQRVALAAIRHVRHRKWVAVPLAATRFRFPLPAPWASPCADDAPRVGQLEVKVTDGTRVSRHG